MEAEKSLNDYITFILSSNEVVLKTGEIMFVRNNLNVHYL